MSSSTSTFQFGIASFGELTSSPEAAAPTARERLDQIVQAAVVADAAGIDFFGAGEHHRPDFAISSPAIVLSAIAASTRDIRLTSAVSVMSTLDPVRLYEDFATLDLISGGRAEIIAGRGVYIDSFPLFGYELTDYEPLFEEKLDLFLEVNRSAEVSWQGNFRPALHNAPVMPRAHQDQIPVWLGVGGTPASAVRAAVRGLPVMFAGIGGDPRGFSRLADLYRAAGAQSGYSADSLRVGMTGHFYVAEDSQQAKAEFYENYRRYWAENTPRTVDMTPEHYEFATGPTGALLVGSPAEVADKILSQHEAIGHDRFMAQFIGNMPTDKVLRSVELLAGEVAPAVRSALGATASEAQSPR
ncbi:MULTISPECIES: LLM class flavin-dependent oxidoreductase [unclassified Diaminobutyricimonas]|uniref:LLM class flavin-dependent oxidoreductase n=1 Tax=unclassified Diaminobutyricimonas TaxID=2643261 RepID=UPI0012F48203|nr:MULTISPECIES: LLM class flavin-dependent oxidoreductase [unclassified Diaminobutyricimonas]